MAWHPAEDGACAMRARLWTRWSRVEVMTETRHPKTAVIVDRHPLAHSVAARAVAGLGWACVGATTAVDALVAVYRDLPALVVVDLDVPDLNGPRLLRQLEETVSGLCVIIVGSPQRRASSDAAGIDPKRVLDRSLATEDLSRIIKRELSTSGRTIRSAEREGWERDRSEFFGQHALLFRQSSQMRAVEAQLYEVAEGLVPVLIEGESGLGKDDMARTLHFLSSRSARSWEKLSCSSIPPELLEAELFGHPGVGGPSSLRSAGRLEKARGGTLLLDEVGEMPRKLQVRLVTLLHANEVHGRGRHPAARDVRLVAATSKDLATFIRAGLFDPELYRRLSVARVRVPPLRERREEVPVLVEHFRDKFARQFGRVSPPLSGEALERLVAYGWPGNRRELENMIKRYVVLGEEKALLQEVESRRQALGARPSPRKSLEDELISGLGLRDIARRAAREAERTAIKEVLERVHGNRAAAARLLRISYKTLLTKLDDEGRSAKLVARPRSRGRSTDLP